MMPTGVFLLLASVLVLLQADFTSGQYPPEFNELVSFLPGYFDNNEQYSDDIARGLPPKLRHSRLALSLRPENITFLSDRRNFYLQEYTGGDLSKLIRQRIYSFGIDPLTLAMQLKLYKLKDPSKFLNAKDYDPLFLTLTPSDVTYLQGCDVYWYKADDTGSERFQSWMKRTCFAEIGGEKVLLVDTNNLTSTYLTVQERWFASNGTQIMGLPTPFNMTKVAATAPYKRHLHLGWRRKSSVLRAPDASLERIARFTIPDGAVLNTFADLLEALFSGRPVRYHATLGTCSTVKTEGSVTPPDEVAALIDAYEYFNFTVLAMDPHVGFSWSAPQVSETVIVSGVQSILTEVRVYDNAQVSITLTFLSGDLRQLLGKVSYQCAMSGGPSKSRPSVTFVVEDVTLTPLTSYEDLRKALQSGNRVHSSSDYGQCSINKTAVGGAAVTEVRLYDDRITSSAQKTITNYQGPGYVYDIVTTTYWSNGSVISTASDRDVVTFKPYYVEQIDCGLIGGEAVRFVKLD